MDQGNKLRAQQEEGQELADQHNKAMGSMDMETTTKAAVFSDAVVHNYRGWKAMPYVIGASVRLQLFAYQRPPLFICSFLLV